jgi:hypothetical protein
MTGRRDMDAEIEQLKSRLTQRDCEIVRLLATVDRLRLALTAIDILHAETTLLVPTLKSIGKLSEEWTDEGERELGDCLYGLSMGLIEIKQKLREVLLP